MNAKKEILELLNESPSRLMCATIKFGKDWIRSSWTWEKEIDLRVGYSGNQFHNFLEKLDFDYDSGFGGQWLFGTVWFEDGTWAERGEYDGSEWWVHKSCPEIPNDLLDTTN